MARKKKDTSSYTYAIDETVIYIGNLYTNYHNTEAKVISRNKTYHKEYYKIQFFDGEIHETTVGALKAKGEEK
jgi:hypothetical protein